MDDRRLRFVLTVMAGALDRGGGRGAIADQIVDGAFDAELPPEELDEEYPLGECAAVYVEQQLGDYKDYERILAAGPWWRNAEAEGRNA